MLSDTPINGALSLHVILSVKGINTTIVRTSYICNFTETCRDITMGKSSLQAYIAFALCMIRILNYSSYKRDGTLEKK